MKRLHVVPAGLVLVGLCLAGGQTASPASSPAAPTATSSPAATTRPITVYANWPFDSSEAWRRQKETADDLGIPREITLELGGNVSMKFALIPAGKFVMGSTDTEQDEAKAQARQNTEGECKEDFTNEGPAHNVVISRPFYMGVCPVTQGQYEHVARRNISRFKGPNLPVDRVSWPEAADFCLRLSQITGRNVTLPTEAQMEYATRAGSGEAPRVGNGGAIRAANGVSNEADEQTDSNEQSDIVIFADRHKIDAKDANFSSKQTLPVGSFKPNAFGLYDTDGNIRQWCSDWYDEGYYDVSPAYDPQGPEKGLYHVARGNGWNGQLWHSRPAVRFRAGKDKKRDIGFRVVVDVPQAQAVQKPDEKAVAELLKALGDDDLKVREASTAKLRKMGRDIQPHLEAALKDKKLEAEVRERISSVLEELKLAKGARAWERIAGKIAYDLAVMAENSPVPEAQIRFYSMAIELNLDYAIAYINRGKAWSDSGNHEGSVGDYLCVIGHNPDYDNIHIAWNNLASDFVMKGMLDHGTRFAKKALEAKADFAMPHFNLGNAAWIAKKYDEAIEHYSKSIELDPNFASAQWSLGVMHFQKKEYDKAIEQYDKAIELKSADARADYFVSRADAYCAKKLYDQALKDASKAIEVDEDCTDAYVCRARILNTTGKASDAMKDLAEAIELSPDKPEAYSVRAWSYYHLKQYDKAWDDVRTVVKKGGAAEQELIDKLLKQ